MASRKPSLSCGRWARISIRGPSRRVRTTENWARSFKLDLPASLIARVVGYFGRASPRKSFSSSFLLFAEPRLAAHEQGVLIEIERRERLGNERFGAVGREPE